MKKKKNPLNLLDEYDKNPHIHTPTYTLIMLVTHTADVTWSLLDYMMYKERIKRV